MNKFISTLLVLCFAATCAQAQSGSVKLVLFSGGYTFPLGVENCGDSRLFVVQKGGQIAISDSNGTHITTPFLDISDRVDATGDETGLLGLAFSPKYKTNGLFYVYYTNKAGNSNISQFKVSADKNVANAASEKVVLQIAQTYRNHVGGCIKFGRDGFLYIGVGDGDGSAVGDPLNYAQNPGLLQGKMLRIKVANNGTYTIPPANPFKDSANYRKEIWAVGLRNPWRFSFDAANGNLWIGDVGEATWEEVDVHKASDKKGGQNYGWHCYEGNAPYNTTGCLPAASYTYPQYQYDHSGGGTVKDCAITGGYVYRGKKYADLYGKYFFTDFCSGVIRSLTVTGNRVTEKDELSSGILYALTSFGEDAKGELYVVSSAGGQVLHLTSSASVSGRQANETASSLNVYPNPSHGQFSVVYTGAKAEAVIINAYNGNGRNIYTANKQSRAGENIWTIQLPNNEKGNCYVTITSASGKMIRRNIVVK